jgi:hypothetical protein
MWISSQEIAAWKEFDQHFFDTFMGITYHKCVTLNIKNVREEERLLSQTTCKLEDERWSLILRPNHWVLINTYFS